LHREILEIQEIRPIAVLTYNIFLLQNQANYLTRVTMKCSTGMIFKSIAKNLNPSFILSFENSTISEAFLALEIPGSALIFKTQIYDHCSKLKNNTTKKSGK